MSRSAVSLLLAVTLGFGIVLGGYVFGGQSRKAPSPRPGTDIPYNQAKLIWHWEKGTGLQAEFLKVTCGPMDGPYDKYAGMIPVPASPPANAEYSLFVKEFAPPQGEGACIAQAVTCPVQSGAAEASVVHFRCDKETRTCRQL